MRARVGQGARTSPPCALARGPRKGVGKEVVRVGKGARTSPRPLRTKSSDAVASLYQTLAVASATARVGKRAARGNGRGSR